MTLRQPRALLFSLAAALLGCAAGEPITPAGTLAAPAAATGAEQIDSALREGRDAAAPCLQLMEHDADEFLDCVRYRARLPQQPTHRDQLRQLGAYWYGWFMADIHAAHGLEGADAAARGLLEDSLRLQEQLGVDPQRLCPLIEAPCERVRNRARERQQEARHGRASVAQPCLAWAHSSLFGGRSEAAG
jgi:hypothetical protein